MCKDFHFTILVQQGSSENDGRSDVNDRFGFKIVSNCCYPNSSHTNCGHFVKLNNFIIIPIPMYKCTSVLVY